jgi:hypothetical protein
MFEAAYAICQISATVLPAFVLGKGLYDSVKSNPSNASNETLDTLKNTLTVDGRMAPDTYRRISKFLDCRNDTFKHKAQVVEFGSEKYIIPEDQNGHWFQTWRGWIYVAVRGTCFVLATNDDQLNTLFKRIISTNYRVDATNNGRKAWYDVAVWPEREVQFNTDLQKSSIELDQYGYILDCGWK